MTADKAGSAGYQNPAAGKGLRVGFSGHRLVASSLAVSRQRTVGGIAATSTRER
jgi:hypothetical protein